MSKPAEDPEKRLTSERFADFVESIDALYIKNNISGRNKFTEGWPDAAHHIFGEELMRFDREGTTDREKRTKLEDEAEGRRLELLDTLSGIEEKSVDKGALQVEYVQSLVNGLGRKMALNVYSRWLVDRFIPPPPGEEAPVAVPIEEVRTEVKPVETTPPPQPVAPQPPPPVEAPIGMPVDPMDRIRPISVEPEMSPPPLPDPEPAPEPVRQPPPQSMAPPQTPVQQYNPPPAPPAPPPQQAAPPAQTPSNPFSPFSRVEEDDDGPALFVAGQVPDLPPAAPKDELIVETEGGSGIEMPTTEQESIAPVVGQKKSGLKIMSIADGDENDPNKSE
jgi:hypothetical protein